MKNILEKQLFFLVTIFIFLAFSISAAGWLYYHSETDAEKERAFKNLEAIADFKVSEISLWRKERLGDAEVLRNNPFLIKELKHYYVNGKTESDILRIQQYLNKVASEYNYSDWFIFDSSNKLIAGSTENKYHLLNFQPWIGNSVWEEPSFSDLHVETNGTVDIDLVIPVITEETKFLVVFLIDPADFLYPRIKLWPGASATGETALVEKNDSEIIFLNELRKKKGTAFKLRMPFLDDLPAVKAVNKISTSMEGRDYMGVPVLAVTRYVEGTPWGIVVKINVDEVLGPLKSRLLFVVISSILLIAMSGTAITFLWQRQKSAIRLSESEKYREIAEKLNMSTAMQKAILDNAGYSIISTTSEGVITTFNKAAEKMLGYSAEEMIGKETPQIVHDADEVRERAAIFSKELNRRIEPGFEVFVARARLNLTNEYEWTYIRKDGSRFPVLLSVTALRNQFGEINGFLGIAADMTRLKETEQAIKKEKETVQTYFDAAGVMFLVLDREGNVARINRRGCLILGYEEKEIIGRNWFDNFIPENLRPEISAVFNKIISGKQELPQHYENPIITKSGEEKMISWNNIIIRDSAGNIEAVLSSGEDVSERKRSEQEYKTIIATAMDSFWIVDNRGRFIDVNEAYCKLIGYSREELLNMTIPEVEAEEKPEEIAAHIEKIIKTGYDRFETKHRRKDSTIVDIEVSTNFVNIYGGRFYVFLRDITDKNIAKENLMKAKDEAEMASRAKSEFLANMSHEIRTPMTSILGMAELLSDTDLDREQEEYLERLRSSGDALISIINDILDISKIEAGQIELEEIEFNLEKEFEKVISIFHVKADKKGLKIISVISDDVPGILVGDPVRLRQILINVLGNAVKFTDSGTVKLMASMDCCNKESAPCRLHVSVHDTGIGIEPEKLENIFEGFVQSDASTTRLYGGTGLGLTISKKLVKLMRGEIWAESIQGKGSTFHICLDLKAGSGETVETSHYPEGTEEHRESKSAMNILLAEDSEDNRLLVKTFLKDSPHSLNMAENGEVAFEMFLAGNYDLVLMDMQMPVMDGYEATRIIRKWEEDQKLGRTPVIAFTAHALREEVEQCIKAGCDDHIAKPIRKKNLIDIISRFGANKKKGNY